MPPINPLQILHTIFLSVAIAALASSLASHEPNFSLAAFAMFFISFRIKVFLDDIRELNGKKIQKNAGNFKFGFFLGIFAWFLFVLAAIVAGKDQKMCDPAVLLFSAMIVFTVSLVISVYKRLSVKDFLKILLFLPGAILLPRFFIFGIICFVAWSLYMIFLDKNVDKYLTIVYNLVYIMVFEMYSFCVAHNGTTCDGNNGLFYFSLFALVIIEGLQEKSYDIITRKNRAKGYHVRVRRHDLRKNFDTFSSYMTVLTDRLNRSSALPRMKSKTFPRLFRPKRTQ